MSISNYITRILKTIFVVWCIGWGEGREGCRRNHLFSVLFYSWSHGWFCLDGMGLVFSLREWEKQPGLAECLYA